MNDVFRAGVAPGGLTMDYEIKVLICYMLSKAERPVPASALSEVLTGEGIANYFEAANAAAALLKSGHIVAEESEDGELCYAVTGRGGEAVESFGKELPSTVKARAVEALERCLLMRRRRAHNRAEIRRVDDGCLLRLTIKDVGSDLLDMTVLLPDRERCERIRERFFEDPVGIYSGLMALLSGGEQDGAD